MNGRKLQLLKKTIRGTPFFQLIIPQAQKRVLCAFSTRSTNSLASFSKLFGIAPNTVVSAKQVHGATVRSVSGTPRGKEIKDCDALITRSVNVPLSIKTADCVPIFIFDPRTPAIAVVHAGWRGTAKNIAEKTIEKMRDSFDTGAKNCIIIIAPSIGPCCYEVDDNVVNRLMLSRKDLRATARKTSEGKWLLDLPRLNALQLIRAGVKKGNIVSSGLCTRCQRSLFHSFRRDRTVKRMYFLAMMRG